MKENNGLLKEEVEGLQRKLERYEKVQAQLVTVELENEVRSWEHLVDEQNRSFPLLHVLTFRLFLYCVT